MEDTSLLIPSKHLKYNLIRKNGWTEPIEHLVNCIRENFECECDTMSFTNSHPWYPVSKSDTAWRGQYSDQIGL